MSVVRRDVTASEELAQAPAVVVQISLQQSLGGAEHQWQRLADDGRGEARGRDTWLQRPDHSRERRQRRQQQQLRTDSLQAQLTLADRDEDAQESHVAAQKRPVADDREVNCTGGGLGVGSVLGNDGGGDDDDEQRTRERVVAHTRLLEERRICRSQFRGGSRLGG